MKKKGFTLVELLAVIAILAILVIMALPAVLRMFTQARLDSFNNELNTIIRTAKQQYLLGGGEAQTWTNVEGSTNKLDLTGNSNLKYSVTMNGQGQVTRIQATNGDFQYSKTGIIDIADKNDIQVVSNLTAGETLTIQNPIIFVNRQNSGSITAGDEVAIDTEHFYVVSSDSTNTVLLTKYNLLIGHIYDTNDGGNTYVLVKTLSSSDPGYGLQNESAKGYYGGTAYDRTGIVPFSGKGYWDNANCVWSGSGTSNTCPGTAGLKSEYANASNAAGVTGNYSTTYPYVYNSGMSSVAPQHGISNDPFRMAQDNGYTIAYYVEEYVNTLKNLGAPSNITGRLLTYDEASNLSSTVKGTGSYWLGSAFSSINIRSVRGGSLSYNAACSEGFYGARPVIVVPTNAMPS